MRIRKTTEADFDRVMEIYAYARDFMARTGNPNQWGPTNWPPEALIHNDIQEGDSSVCTNDDGNVIGMHNKDYGLTDYNIEPGDTGVVFDPLNGILAA